MVNVGFLCIASLSSIQHCAHCRGFSPGGSLDLGCHLYVMCPNLYAIQLAISYILVPDSPLERLGLTHTSKHMLLLVACTFAGYHAVKRSDLTASCDAETPLDIVQQLRAANLFADAFRAEADEVRLPIRAGRLEHSPGHLNPFRIVRRAPA